MCPTLSGRTRTNPDIYSDKKIADYYAFKPSTRYPDEPGQTGVRVRARTRVTDDGGSR